MSSKLMACVIQITKILVVVTAVLFVSVPVFASSGTTSKSIEVINNVSIGDVNIELYELTVGEDGKEYPLPDKSEVIPGDDLSQIVRIRNVANDVWIRVKLEFDSDIVMRGLGHDLVTLASTGWKRIGDYYYATKPLKSWASVDFMKSIHIPEYWTEDYSNKEFRVTVSVDAVQTKNFTPDFSSNDPWFGTVIEQCVHDARDSSVTISMEPFSIEFRNGAEGFIHTGDDFFSHWGEMMPGDTYKDYIDIKNRYSAPVSLSFSVENIADPELLQTLDLLITTAGGEVLYSGKMHEAFIGELPFGKYMENTSDRIYYSVHLPETAGNEFALKTAKTKWIFTAEVDKSGESGLGNKQKKNKSSGSGDKSSDGSSGKQSATGSLKSPQTGDVRSVLIIFIFAAYMALIIYVARNRFGGAKK